MTILGIVPARGGSKRVLRKNLRELQGRPLLRWAVEAALDSSRLDRVVVSSDDVEVLDVARSIDPSLPLRRPAAIAGDESPAIAYVKHACKEVERSEGGRIEVVVIIQPSSPLTQGGDIDATVDLLLSSGADSAVTVMAVDHVTHPLKMKVMDSTGKLLPLVEEERGRQMDHELPRVFVRNGAVYATRRAVIDEGSILGEDSRGYVMPVARSIDINTELDLRFARFLLSESRPEPEG